MIYLFLLMVFIRIELVSCYHSEYIGLCWIPSSVHLFLPHCGYQEINLLINSRNQRINRENKCKRIIFFRNYINCISDNSLGQITHKTKHTGAFSHEEAKKKKKQQIEYRNNLSSQKTSKVQ